MTRRARRLKTRASARRGDVPDREGRRERPPRPWCPRLFPVVAHTTAAHVNPAASISSNARSAGLCASTVNGGAATSPRSATVTSSARAGLRRRRRLDVRGSRFERRRTSKSPPRTSCAIRPRGRGRARRRDDTRGRRGRRGKNTRRTVRGRRFARSSGRRETKGASTSRTPSALGHHLGYGSKRPLLRARRVLGGAATRVSCAGRRRGSAWRDSTGR